MRSAIASILLCLPLLSLASVLDVPMAIQTPQATQWLASLPTLSRDKVEKKLVGEHPGYYYVYAWYLWSTGRRDDAVFWFYAGQLRYRFHLAANPALKSTMDGERFAMLQREMGEPINLYAGADPARTVQIYDAVLEWDAKSANGHTSKTRYRQQWEQTRNGLMELRDYTASHQEQMREIRAQNGIGDIGVIDGVYVEQRNEKMPKEWPPLLAQSAPETLAGQYDTSRDDILKRVLFFDDQDKVLHATVVALSFPQPDQLLAVARKGEEELLRRTIAVRREGDAIVFEQNRADGNGEGRHATIVRLRMNGAGELVMQRDYLREGKFPDETLPVRLSYTFWNRFGRMASR